MSVSIPPPYGSTQERVDALTKFLTSAFPHTRFTATYIAMNTSVAASNIEYDISGTHLECLSDDTYPPANFFVAFDDPNTSKIPMIVGRKIKGLTYDRFFISWPLVTGGPTHNIILVSWADNPAIQTTIVG